MSMNKKKKSTHKMRQYCTYISLSAPTANWCVQFLLGGTYAECFEKQKIKKAMDKEKKSIKKKKKK